MVWILSTCGRPHLCQKVIDGAEKHGFTGPGLISIDGDDSTYDLSHSDAWMIKRWGDHVGHNKQLNYMLEAYPDAKSYGILCDDQVPETAGWQHRLEEAAGDWYIASAEDRLSHGRKRNGSAWLGAAPCIGGELARLLGRFAPPETFQRGSDHFLAVIGDEFGLLRFCPDVVVHHLHWRNEGRKSDETDAIATRAQWRDLPKIMSWLEHRRYDDFVRCQSRLHQVLNA